MKSVIGAEIYHHIYALILPELGLIHLLLYHLLSRPPHLPYNRSRRLAKVVAVSNPSLHHRCSICREMLALHHVATTEKPCSNTSHTDEQQIKTKPSSNSNNPQSPSNSSSSRLLTSSSRPLAASITSTN